MFGLPLYFSADSPRGIPLYRYVQNGRFRAETGETVNGPRTRYNAILTVKIPSPVCSHCQRSFRAVTTILRLNSNGIRVFGFT